MFGKILIAAGAVAGALMFQTAAHAADVRFGIHIGNGFEFAGQEHDGHSDFGRREDRRHGHGFHDDRDFYRSGSKYDRYVLSDREILYRLSERGLYNIRFIDRRHGVAKVIANSRRGYVAKYAVDVRSGRILDREIVGRHYGYRGGREDLDLSGNRGR